MQLSQYSNPEPTDTPQAPNFGLLSCCAAYLRQKVSRRSHLSGTMLYPQSFTVRDIKATLHACLAANEYDYIEDDTLIIAIVSSLERQTFFYIVNWKDMSKAADDDVCMFLYYDEDEEPPTGVFPPLIKCYSPTCEESGLCYSPSCPNKSRGRSESLPLPSAISECYSPTCDRGTGCYSPTCPHRHFDFPKPHGNSLPNHGSPMSSRGPPTPTDEPSITWIGGCRGPCLDRPRHSLSSYLIGFRTEGDFTDYWISAAGVR